MASYYTLAKQGGYNPYFCANRKIEKISFYCPEKGECLMTHNSGWLSTGCNNDGNSALEGLEYRDRRKPFLNLDEPHCVGDELFVPITALDDVVVEFDAFHTEYRDGERKFGNHITFSYGATRTEFEHLKEVKPRRNLIGSYTRTEHVGMSKRVEEVHDLFRQTNKMNLSRLDIEKLLKSDINLRSELARLLVSPIEEKTGGEV